MASYGKLPLSFQANQGRADAWVQFLKDIHDPAASPSSVGACANCPIKVAFKPAALRSRSAAFAIMDSGLDSPQTVTLAGSGANPVPFIYQPLVPTSVAPGGPEFILTVNGTGFRAGATVNWNGVALATSFVSSERLTATVPAGNIASPGTAQVTVANPGSAPVSNTILFQVAASLPWVRFGNAPGSPIAVGTDPNSIAVGDFNGDGRLDLAVANNVSGGVTILLSNGDGTFTPAASLAPTGIFPHSIAVGDFNGDGKLDLVTSNPGSQNLTILLGNGDGMFTPAAESPAAGVQPQQVVVGDFNGDGKLDLAVADSYTNDVIILLGNGDGTFTPSAVSPATGSAPIALAVGDLNGDGKLDLAVANEFGSSLTILLGNGDGTFTPAAASPATGSHPWAIAVGDFNGDGKLDLAVVSEGVNNVTILLGNGDGTFTAAASPATGIGPAGIALGDFNGDGKLDLAITNVLGGNVTILLGNGDGTFTASASSPATGQYPTPIAVGDFNGDGRLDLATGNEWPNNVSILLQLPVVLSPASLSFGNVEEGTSSAAKTITLTNNQEVALTDIGVAITGSTDYTQTNTCGTSIDARKKCTITVTFKPSILGTDDATLSISDSASNSPQTVALTGTGVMSVELSPTSLTFGSVDEGVSSAAKTITMTNYQKVELTGISVGITGSTDYTQTNTCGTSILAGKKCTITVTLKPSIIGTDNATLSISDSASNSPQTAALTGTGTTPVGLTPTSDTFVSEKVGATSPAKVLTLTSYLSSTVNNIAISATGDFAVSSTTCTTSLTAKAKCTIDVVFKPTATGTRTGTLKVSDSAANSPQSSTLTGTGK